MFMQKAPMTRPSALRRNEVEDLRDLPPGVDEG